MRRLSPFTVEMGRPTPGLDDLAFSLSREFGALDIRSACDALDDGHIHRVGAANERPGRGDDPLEARDRLPEALLDVDDDERRTLRVELGAHPATFIVNSRRR